MEKITIEQSGAFIETFSVDPTGSGALNGLRFAVKDLVDVAGYRTGRGNPTWRDATPAAAVSAPCVELLLAAGAACIGKTITDELAYSLLGENHHYGTPLNAAVPERVPGGSSSGSASAVACGLVDFAIGTDTGGSVRVPASNCGIWGWRPTHGVVSVAGVMPLAPSFDTVGILARDAEVLRRASLALLAREETSGVASRPKSLKLLDDAFAWADVEVSDAVRAAVDRLSGELGVPVERTSLAELCGDSGAGESDVWVDIYRCIVGAEAASSHGSWIASEKPTLGPMTETGFSFALQLERPQLRQVFALRERYYRNMQESLAGDSVLVMPTSPTVAPMKGEVKLGRDSDYYQRALAFNSIAGTARIPQISMPLATAVGAPIGVSILGTRDSDAFLLNVAYGVERVLRAA